MPSSQADRRDRDETAPAHNRRATDRNRRATDRIQTVSTVSLVIPARNEARNLAVVLENLPDCVSEVILVDGKSSDVTTLMALNCRPDIRIITEPAPGKGHALRAGFDAASGDVIIAMDADGSMLPQEIPQILYFLDHGYDFVKGSRFIGGGSSLDITPFRKLGNRGLLFLANRFFQVQLTDLCYGFFGFRRAYLDHLGLTSSGFEIETELTVRAITSGLRIAEVPSIELPRRSGSSNLNSIRDGIRVLRMLLRERSGSIERPVPPLPTRQPTTAAPAPAPAPVDPAPAPPHIVASAPVIVPSPVAELGTVAELSPVAERDETDALSGADVAPAPRNRFESA